MKLRGNILNATGFVGRDSFDIDLERQREIGHGIIDEVDEKVKRLKYDSRKSVRTALVYDGRRVASVPAARYFDFLLPAEKLLGNCQI